MKIGVLISTYGTPAFIHLQLAAAKKYYPGLPIAVVDDRSTETPALQALCEAHQATFFAHAQNPAVDEVAQDPRAGGISVKHFFGDLSALARGFHWARAQELDVLVKFSRRFIPLYDWTGELTRIILATGYPAYSAWDVKDCFLFKTEAAAYLVDDWFRYGGVEAIERQSAPALIEGFLWELNQRIWTEKKRDPALGRTDRIFREGASLGYGPWFIGGTARDQPLPWRLWHAANTPADYLRAARELGVDTPYTEADFPATLTETPRKEGPLTSNPADLLEEARGLDRAGKKDPAREAYRRYLDVQPLDPDAWADLGGLLLDLGRPDEAQEACAAALRIDAHHYPALVHSALVWMRQGRLAEAEQRFRTALALAPARLGARLTLSDCLLEQGDLDQARTLLENILEDQPDHRPALDRLETLYVRQQDWPSLRRSLERQVNAASGPEKDYRRSHLSLLFGEMPLGWDQFESRLWLPGRVLSARPFPQPRWQGEAFQGKTLLLNWEQGFGDTLMFLRYAPLVKALGGRVLVEVQPPLAELARTCPGVDGVIADGDPLPPFDLHAPLLSLPAIFRTTRDSVPADIPYLDIPQEVPNRAWIQEALAPSVGRLRIGLVWAGSALHARNGRRSIPFESLAPLAEWSGVAWHSFQLDAEALPPLPGIRSLAPLLSNFSDTAYALSGMDLIITVDTALAHLAGALGIPTWLLVSFIPDWRWLLGREDSPWYPTVRLFRQTRPGDWTGILRQMTALVSVPS